MSDEATYVTEAQCEARMNHAYGIIGKSFPRWAAIASIGAGAAICAIIFAQAMLSRGEAAKASSDIRVQQTEIRYIREDVTEIKQAQREQTVILRGIEKNMNGR